MIVLNKHLDDDTYYMPVPVTCRVVKAYSVVDTQDLTDALGTITLSDGTSTIGTITVAHEAAEGDVDSLVLDGTTKGKVELDKDTPLQIVFTGHTEGEVELTVVFDEFHADN
jgi:hypothetical protein